MPPNPIDFTLGHFILLTHAFFYEFSGSVVVGAASEAAESDSGTNTDETETGTAVAGQRWQRQGHRKSKQVLEVVYAKAVVSEAMGDIKIVLAEVVAETVMSASMAVNAKTEATK